MFYPPMVPGQHGQLMARQRQQQAQAGQQGGYGLPGHMQQHMKPREGFLGRVDNAMQNPLFHLGIGMLSQGASTTPINPWGGLSAGMATYLLARKNTIARDLKLMDLQAKMDKQSFERQKYEQELLDTKKDKEAKRKLVESVDQGVLDRMGISREGLMAMDTKSIAGILEDAHLSPGSDMVGFERRNPDLVPGTPAFNKAYVDEQRALARAKSTRMTIDQRGESAYAKAVGGKEGGAASALEDTIQNTRIAANTKRLELGELETVVSQANIGRQQWWQAPMQSLAATLGFPDWMGDDWGTLTAKDRIKRFQTEYALDLVQQTKGSISNYEMQMFERSVPNLLYTPQGMQLFVDVNRAMLDHNEKLGAWLQETGLTPFDKEYRRKVANWHEANPLFTPELNARILDHARQGREAEAGLDEQDAVQRATTTPINRDSSDDDLLRRAGEITR